MKKQDVIDTLTSGAMFIQFEYKGLNGFIDAFVNGAGVYSMYYGEDTEAHVEGIHETMAYPLFDGKSLDEICEIVEYA